MSFKSADAHDVDDSLPEHPDPELLDLFVALDEAGVAAEDMPKFADLTGGEHDG